MAFTPADEKRETGGGVRCPKCGGEMRAVIDSRPSVVVGAGTIRRRRSCAGCGDRMTTFEVSEHQLLRMKADIAKAMTESLMKEFWT